MVKKQAINLEQRLENLLEYPMLGFTFLLIPVIAIPILYNPSPIWAAIYYWLDIGIWLAFYAEFFAKFAVSKDRVRTVRKNWFMIVILIAPALRPLRIISLSRILRIVRLLRLQSIINKLKGNTQRLVYNIEYIVVTFLLLIISSAFIVWQLETLQGGSINTYGDALWWSIITITTVGYGDIIPATSEGKIVGGVLSLVGIILFMVIVAKITSIFIESKIDSEQNRILQKLSKRVQKIETH
jgi:voltage-gated potassium channel